MLLSILSLALTEPVCAGFWASWTRQHVTCKQQEKALASLNVPESLPEMVLKNLKEKLSEKKTGVMPRYSLYMAWAGRIEMKDKKINKNSMFSL